MSWSAFDDMSVDTWLLAYPALEFKAWKEQVHYKQFYLT